jgi:ATP-dependent RNA helicase RhlE
VVSYDLPNCAEDYVHRAGRTARAEAKGDALLFVAPEEERHIRGIEKVIGNRISRHTLPDFDYTASVAVKSERPHFDRPRHEGSRNERPRSAQPHHARSNKARSRYERPVRNAAARRKASSSASRASQRHTFSPSSFEHSRGVA